MITVAGREHRAAPGTTYKGGLPAQVQFQGLDPESENSPMEAGCLWRGRE